MTCHANYICRRMSLKPLPAMPTSKRTVISSDVCTHVYSRWKNYGKQVKEWQATSCLSLRLGVNFWQAETGWRLLVIFSQCTFLFPSRRFSQYENINVSKNIQKSGYHGLKIRYVQWYTPKIPIETMALGRGMLRQVGDMVFIEVIPWKPGAERRRGGAWDIFNGFNTGLICSSMI